MTIKLFVLVRLHSIGGRNMRNNGVPDFVIV